MGVVEMVMKLMDVVEMVIKLMDVVGVAMKLMGLQKRVRSRARVVLDQMEGMCTHI